MAASCRRDSASGSGRSTRLARLLPSRWAPLNVRDCDRLTPPLLVPKNEVEAARRAAHAHLTASSPLGSPALWGMDGWYQTCPGWSVGTRVSLRAGNSLAGIGQGLGQAVTTCPGADHELPRKCPPTRLQVPGI